MIDKLTEIIVHLWVRLDQNLSADRIDELISTVSVKLKRRMALLSASEVEGAVCWRHVSRAEDLNQSVIIELLSRSLFIARLQDFSQEAIQRHEHLSLITDTSNVRQFLLSVSDDPYYINPYKDLAMLNYLGHGIKRRRAYLKTHTPGQYVRALTWEIAEDFVYNCGYLLPTSKELERIVYRKTAGGTRDLPVGNERNRLRYIDTEIGLTWLCELRGDRTKYLNRQCTPAMLSIHKRSSSGKYAAEN